MKNYFSEIIVTALLVIVAALLWNPFWMPMGAIYAIITGFVVLLGGFIAFVWHERGGDEREVLIRQIASRTAHLCGTLVLAIGIIYQTLAWHAVDAWLISAFMITVLAKAIGYAYGKAQY